MTRKYILMTSSAHVKGKARQYGKYANVAVVEVDTDQLPEGHDKPAMISTRAKGVVRIVEMWEARSVGKTEKSQFHVAMREANELLNKLNHGA